MLRRLTVELRLGFCLSHARLHEADPGARMRSFRPHSLLDAGGRDRLLIGWLLAGRQERELGFRELLL